MPYFKTCETLVIGIACLKSLCSTSERPARLEARKQHEKNLLSSRLGEKYLDRWRIRLSMTNTDSPLQDKAIVKTDRMNQLNELKRLWDARECVVCPGGEGQTTATL